MRYSFRLNNTSHSVLFGLLVFFVSHSPLKSLGQPTKPVSLKEVETILESRFITNPEDRYRSLIEQVEKRGVDFVITTEIWDEAIQKHVDNIKDHNLIYLITVIQQFNLKNETFIGRTTFPQNVKAQVNLARMKVKEGKRISNSNDKKFEATYSEAISAYNNAINLSPESAMLYYERARALEFYSEFGVGSGRDPVGINKIIADYTKAISLIPEAAIFHYYRGLAYFKLSRYGGKEEQENRENSLRDHAEFLRLRPQFVNALDNSYSTLFYYLGNDSANTCNSKGNRGEACGKALSYLTNAINLSPWEYDYYDRRAQVFGFVKEYDKGIEDLTKAIQIIVNDTGTGYFGVLERRYQARAHLFNERGAYDSAISDYTKAIEVARRGLTGKFDLPELYTQRADAYERIGRKDLAENDRTKAKEKPQQ